MKNRITSHIYGINLQKKKVVIRNRLNSGNSSLINIKNNINNYDNINNSFFNRTSKEIKLKGNILKTPKKISGSPIKKGISENNSFLKYFSNIVNEKEYNEKENEKNLFEQKLKNNNIVKYLIKETDKQNYQKCQEMKKTIFFSNNIHDKVNKQHSFYHIKK